MSFANFGWAKHWTENLTERPNLLLEDVNVPAVENEVRTVIKENKAYTVHGPYVYDRKKSGEDGETLEQDSMRRFQRGAWFDAKIMHAFELYLNKCEFAFTEKKPRCLMATQHQIIFGYMFAQGLKPEFAGAIFNTERVPHQGNHWMLYWAAFDHPKKTFQLTCYDSLKSKETKSHNTVRDEEARVFFSKVITPADAPSTRRHRTFDTISGFEPYTMVGPVRTGECPQQENGDDCGVFALACAFFLFADPTTDPDFSPDAGPRFRMALANRVLMDEEFQLRERASGVPEVISIGDSDDDSPPPPPLRAQPPPPPPAQRAQPPPPPPAQRAQPPLQQPGPSTAISQVLSLMAEVRREDGRDGSVSVRTVLNLFRESAGTPQSEAEEKRITRVQSFMRELLDVRGEEFVTLRELKSVMGV